MKKEDQRKIEIETLLKNQKDIPPETIDEITHLISDSVDNKQKEVEKEDILSQIKIKMLEEDNWRKKAILAAMYISKSLK